MVQIDHTKSELENFMRLVNDGVRFPATSSRFTRELLDGYPGNPENNYRNTRVRLTGTDPDLYRDWVDVNYRRLTLAENHPTGGTRVFVDNADSHSAVQARILNQLKIVGSEVTWTLPQRRPEFGEKANYVLTPRNRSYLYTGGSLTVEAVNNSPVLGTEVHPSYLFGNSLGLLNGFPVFNTGAVIHGGDDITLAKTSQQILLDKINAVLDLNKSSNQIFTPDNFTYTPIGGSASQMNVKLELQENSFLTAPCYLRYSLSGYFNSSVGRTYHNVPASIMNTTNQAALTTLLFEYMNWSAEDFRVRYFDTNTTTVKELVIETRGTVYPGYLSGMGSARFWFYSN